MIDKLLREFQYWNKVVPSHIPDRKNKFVQVSQLNGVACELVSLEDSMGLETIIYYQLQKSTDLISQDPYYNRRKCKPCRMMLLLLKVKTISRFSPYKFYKLHPKWFPI